MLLLLAIAAILAIQIGWISRSIRREFSTRGLHVHRVRWLPLKPLLDGRLTRRQMLYRVGYTDRRGDSRSCLVVWTFFAGYTTEEDRPDMDHERVPLELARGLEIPWLAIACAVVGCVAIGIQYWTPPYREVNLPSSLIGPGLILVGVSGGVLQFLQPRRKLTTFAILSLAPVATVIVRIAMDLSRDPTSHNLFPFELVIAAFVGAVTVGLGMATGGFLRRVTSGVGAPHARG